jgi:hypothetical protein
MINASPHIATAYRLSLLVIEYRELSAQEVLSGERV